MVDFTDMLNEELDLWQAERATPQLWLRDDDAVEVTSALRQLTSLCSAFEIEVLVAIIPKSSTAELHDFLLRHPGLCAAQHGFDHQNYASATEKKCELGGQRPLKTVLTSLQRGREILQAAYGAALSSILVPPWNRIDPHIVSHLPEIDIHGLSTFSGKVAAGVADKGSVRHLECHLDLIDWRGSRRTRPAAELIATLLGLLRQSRGNGQGPIGILTHHLVHDREAWEFLTNLMDFFERRQLKVWVSANRLLESKA